MLGSLAAALLLAGCAPRYPEDPARASALQFWRALASEDLWAVVQVSSFPFALDAHDECVAGPRELSAALTEQLGREAGGLKLVVGDARRVTRTSEIEERWQDKRDRFLGDDARCLSASDQPAPTVNAEGLHYYLVDFTVDGEPVGALTRVRCKKGDCGVTGIDN